MLFANSFESKICLWAPDALGLGYGLLVGQALYAIDAFPDDDLLWRIEWVGGVGYNTSVPSEPQFVWRSSPKARRTRSAHERVPLKSRRER